MTDQKTNDEGLDEAGRWFDFSRKQWVALAAAALFFAGAVGFSVGEFLSRPPAEDSVDVGFLRDMITHHEQALTMARLDDAYGAEFDVEVFAREIILFQSYEIGLMERQLGNWGYDRADRPGTAMRWMGDPTPVDEMPGLASSAEVELLRRSRGRDVDALFVPLMQDHHRGGVHMASYAAKEASDPFVRKLAEQMARNQRIEIDELEAARKRARLPASPTGYTPAEIPQDRRHHR